MKRVIIIILAAIVIILIAARMYLNTFVLNHVNHVLNTIEGYQGSVRDIDIALYRGAYTIYDLKLDKKASGIPVPFVAIEQADLSIQWSGLLRGRIISEIELVKPVITFAKNNNQTQTGENVDWTKPITSLMPIDINRISFTQGRLAYQDFSASPQVNIYIHNMIGEVRNLRNVDDANSPLPSELQIRGNSIGKGRLAITGKLNILKEFPDMDIAMQLENVYLPAMNDYTKAYAAIDVESGNLNVYSELVVKDRRVSGYVKPLATDIHIIDLQGTNPIKLAWETVAAVIVTLFTNQRKDQFATRAELTGDLSNIETNTWSVIAGIIKNAFLEALDKGFDGESEMGTGRD